jgi:hypothetical protein
MKATVMGEVLLLVGLLAVAYLVYIQQAQLVELELELDKLRGAVGATLPPVPAATNSDEAKAAPAARPKRAPKPKPEAGT